MHAESKDLLERLLSLYDTLCRHCDGIYTSARSLFADAMACGEGCASCCTIQSVSKLEAFVIRRYVDERGIRIEPAARDACVFLDRGSCRIYPVRPVICRTHGLVLYDSEQKALAHSCEKNFEGFDLTRLDRGHIVDTLNITENLIRLNLAFLQITGDSASDSGRIPLSALVGDLPNT